MIVGKSELATRKSVWRQNRRATGRHGHNGTHGPAPAYGRNYGNRPIERESEETG
jgi:hypothetical protein